MHRGIKWSGFGVLLICIFLGLRHWVEWRQKQYFNSLPYQNIDTCPFRTGDLLLNTDGRINIATGGLFRYAHVAMIYREPRNNLVYVWDLTSAMNVLCKAPWQARTRLMLLSSYYEQMIVKRKQNLVWRHLKVEITADRASQALQKMYETPCAIPLFHWGLQRFLSIFHRPILPQAWQLHAQHYKAANCAMMIGRTYEALGLLDLSDWPADYVLQPIDFAQETENLPWIWSSLLGPEVYLGAKN